MKKFLLLAVFSFVFATFSQAQKYAIIDTKYILDKMPDYRAAQKQLDIQDIYMDFRKLEYPY